MGTLGFPVDFAQRPPMTSISKDNLGLALLLIRTSFAS